MTFATSFTHLLLVATPVVHRSLAEKTGLNQANTYELLGTYPTGYATSTGTSLDLTHAIEAKEKIRLARFHLIVWHARNALHHDSISRNLHSTYSAMRGIDSWGLFRDFLLHSCHRLCFVSIQDLCLRLCFFVFIQDLFQRLCFFVS